MTTPLPTLCVPACAPRLIRALVIVLCMTLCVVLAEGVLAPVSWGDAPAGDGSWDWRSPQPQGAAIAGMDFSDAMHGVAVGFGVVMWTADGGGTWEASIPGTSSGPYVGAAQYDLGAVAMANASTGWAVGQDLYSGDPLLLKTEDGGRTWSTQDPGAVVGRLVAVAAADSSTAFAVGRDEDNAVVLRTGDGGATWSVCWSSSSRAELGGVACLDAQQVCVVGVHTASTGHRRALIVTTTDGGARWTEREAGPSRAFALNAVCAAGESGYRAAGFIESQTLASRDGGATWQGTRVGFDGVQCIAFADARHGIVAGWGANDYKGCGVTSDGGRTWAYASPLGAFNRSIDAVAFAGPDRPVAAGGDGRIAVSDAAGVRWRRVAGLDADGRDGATFSDGALTDTSGIWLCGARGIWWDPKPVLAYSKDRGCTWSLADLAIGHGVFADVVFSDAASGWLVYRAGPYTNSLSTALSTADGGGTWVPHRLPITSITDSGLQTTDADHAWLLGSRRSWADCVVHTADGGDSWAWSSPPGAPADLAGISFVGEDQGWLVGSRSTRGPDTLNGVHSPAIFVTRDGGVSWIEQSCPVTRGRLDGVQFRDGLHGIAWGVRAELFDGRHRAAVPLLLATSDGGDTWRVAAVPVAYGKISKAEFRDSECGWVSGYTHSFLDPEEGSVDMPFVCTTSDGGVTWHFLESAAGGSWAMRASEEGAVTAVGPSAAVIESAIGGMPLVDRRGPFTTVAVAWGWATWASTTFSRSLRAVDIGRSGVAGTAWRVDRGAWTDDSTVVVPVPADHGSDGRHVVEYYSWDRLGNKEPLRSFTITVDTRGPRCTAYGQEVSQGSWPRLVYRVADELSPTARVTVTVVNETGRIVRRRAEDGSRIGTPQTWRLAGRLPAGHYTWTVTAVDLAGNPQERSGSARLIVR